MRDVYIINERYTLSVFDCFAIPCADALERNLLLWRKSRCSLPLYHFQHIPHLSVPRVTLSLPPTPSASLSISLPSSLCARQRKLSGVGDALAFLHEQGIVHNDVKPGNILHDRDVTKFVLTDLGIAGGKCVPVEKRKHRYGR